MKLLVVALVIGLTLFHTLVQGPELSRLRQEQIAYPDDKDLRREIRSKAAQAGIVSASTSWPLFWSWCSRLGS